MPQLPHILCHDGLAKNHSVKNGISCQLAIADPLCLHAVSDLPRIVMLHCDILIAFVDVEIATLFSRFLQIIFDGPLHQL